MAARLLELKDGRGPIAANRARASLNALFVSAMQQGLAETNPVVGTAPPGEERARERTLSAAEVRAIWEATDGPGDYNAIIRLLMLTGQRREEVAGMAWTELDLEQGIWVIPAQRTKNKRVHEVPISRQAAALLERRPRWEMRDLLFGIGAGPFSGWSRAKARLDRHSGVKGWVVHDLRRTLVTVMHDLGMAPHIVEAVVNHLSGHKAGVAGIYNRATYATEKRRALQAWADYLGEITAGLPRKVVPFVRASV